VVDLQEESSKTDNAGQASAGEGDLASGGNGDRGGLGADTGAGRSGRRASGLGLLGLSRLSGNNNPGGVGVAGSRAAVVADNSGGGDDGLGDGARAVSDGEGGGLSDGVSLVTVGDLGGARAVGGVDVDDLSGVGDVAGVASIDASGSSEDGSSRELHFD